MKLRSVEAEVSHAEERTGAWKDGQTHTHTHTHTHRSDEANSGFRNFVNKPKN